MNPTLPHKRSSFSNKNQRQSLLRRQNKYYHQKSNSMMDFLQIKGKDRRNEFSQRTIKQSQSQKQQAVEEVVEREFIMLKKNVQSYCKKLNRKFVQLQKMENTIKEQGKYTSPLATQEDIFSLLIGRIKEFLNKNQPENNPQSGSKKLQFPPSSSNSLNVQSHYSAGNTDEVQKIQDIQVLEVYKNSKLSKISVTKQVLQPPQSNPNNSSTYQKIYSSNFINSLPIACSSTISEILYKQAGLKSFPQFHKFCQKILLQKKPIISEFNYFKKQKIQKTNFYLGQIYRKLSLLNTRLSNAATGEMNVVKRANFIGNQDKGMSIGQQIDEICVVLKKLNQLHNLKSMIFECSRPCCKPLQNYTTTSTKAKILQNLKQAAKKSLHYKTEISDQYFNRYYNKQSFDRTRIYSLSKTKTQQMQELQRTYYRNKDNKKACKKRCNSLFENLV